MHDEVSAGSAGRDAEPMGECDGELVAPCGPIAGDTAGVAAEVWLRGTL